MDDNERAYSDGARDARSWLKYHKPGAYAIAEDLHSAKQAHATAGREKNAYASCYWDGYLSVMELAAADAGERA